MKKALAFLFQREGSSVKEEDFIYTQSVDLEWFTSEEARKLKDRAMNSGLIKVDDGLIEADFDYDEIDIPIGFEPSKDILEEKRKDLFSGLLSEMVDNSSLSKQEVMSEVNDLQDRLNIEIITAMLLVAKKNNIKLKDLDKKVEEVRDKIKR